MKRTFLFTFFVLAGIIGHAQVLHTKWKQSTKKINDCEYDLIFTVTIDKGRHITSIKDEGYPTSIAFKPGADYSLVGGLTESKPTTEYDPTLKSNVYVHYNTATFTQRIKLHSANKFKITGTYEYQICTGDVCEFPPKDPFTFDLQGSATCKK